MSSVPDSNDTVDLVLRFDEVRAEDLDRILAIEQVSFPQPWSRRSFERELGLAFSRTLVARLPDEGAIVGYVCRWRMEDEVQVLNVAVAPEARRRGVGRELMVAVLEEAGRVGLPVTLEVAEDNAEAIALYEALGFERSGERKNFYGRGRNGLMMTRAAHQHSY